MEIKINDIFSQIGNYISKFDHEKIEMWENFVVDFSTPFDKKDSVISLIKQNIPNHKTMTGIYAIFDGKTCLYIGVGRPIWSRLKCHYNASQGKDQAKNWVGFFSQYKKPLRIFWLEYNEINDTIIGDQTRILIEHLLQHIYLPMFGRDKKLNQNLAHAD